MKQSVEDLFRQQGDYREIGGNTPFLLKNADTAWFILRGNVEVFTVRVEDGKSSGTRYHFLSSRTGDLLFGMDFERYGQGLGFLAVGVVGTQIIEVPVSFVRKLIADPEYQDSMQSMMNHWITGLSIGTTKSIVPHPRADLLLEPGQKEILEDGKRARARKEVVWIRQKEGSSLFVGMEELSFGDQDVLFPVSSDTWIQSIGSLKLEVRDTSTALKSDSAWVGLESLYQAIFACEFFNTTLSAVDEYNRLRKKAEREQLTRQKSLLDLAAIMVRRPTMDFAGELEDPLFTACQAVGKAAGIRFQPPPRRKDQEKSIDPLAEIGRASRIRTRPVVLEGQWWKNDGGPLLAYMAEDRRPVALVPTSPREYQLHDPGKKTTALVTATIASKLSPNAVSFYRPFPNRIIGATDLLRFGAFGSKRDLWTVLLMGLAMGLLSLVPPIATGLIFDTIIPEAERTQVLQICLALLTAALAIAMFHVTQSMALLRVEGKMDGSINAAMMDRLLNLPVPFFRKFSAGDLANRTLGISEIRRLLTGSVLVGIVTHIFLLLNFLLLFYYDWSLALIATAVTAVVLAFTSFAGYLQLKYQRQLKQLQGKISGLVLQLITGISKIRVAGAEGHAFAYWAGTFAEQKKVAFRARTAFNDLFVFNSTLPVLSSAALFAWVAFYSGDPMISTGHFLAFNAAFVQFLLACTVLNSSLMVILGLVPFYERAKPILQALPEVDSAKAHPGELSGQIELSHVSFRYESDGPPILRDISMRVNPGEFVALVGPSGTGKSTMFRLLLGFEKPERGSIHYDGQDLSVLDVQAVRRQVGVVLQHSKMMAGDIFHNIVGSAPLTLEDAWEAARMAGVDEDIRQMPMGMLTMVSEGGQTFSGGQRQRLLIARALALKPRIVLFDEATSALDNRTQSVVSESLQKLQATRIVIAHRLSTIMHADRILVMDNGSIVQSGTYEELMQDEKGMFVELARRQLA